MEINGKKLQQELLVGLKTRIEKVKEKGLTPCIAIVTLGPEETWEAYVGQKIKMANDLGIEAKLISLKPQKTEDVLSVINELNHDASVHGLIVQRPFPTHIDTERVIQNVSKDKDIDGFRNDSSYSVPVWLAVKQLLTQASLLLNGYNFHFWLSNQHILIVGKGETAGEPMIQAFEKMKIKTTVADSKTSDINSLFRNSDIIIFATGKRIDVPFALLKKECILIGIGLHRKDGHLQGDFDEIEAKRNGLYYTPSPGGVGPLNLYYLFENLITATENALD